MRVQGPKSAKARCPAVRACPTDHAGGHGARYSAPGPTPAGCRAPSTRQDPPGPVGILRASAGASRGAKGRTAGWRGPPLLVGREKRKGKHHARTCFTPSCPDRQHGLGPGAMLTAPVVQCVRDIQHGLFPQVKHGGRTRWVGRRRPTGDGAAAARRSGRRRVCGCCRTDRRAPQGARVTGVLRP